MLDLNSYITTDRIVHDIQAKTKEEVIRILIEKMYKDPSMAKYPVSANEAYEEVISRETLQTTGVGNGLAFPHARIDGWEGFSIIVGVCANDIDFKSLDKKPVKFVFLMISSPEEPYIILQAMSAIVRMLADMGFEQTVIKNNKDIERVLERLLKKEIKTIGHIMARDIAIPVTDFVTLDMSVEEVSKKMHLDTVDLLPVVRDKNKFCGQISCNDIFKYSLPDFFKQLNTISFVRHMDPFEKYFKEKKNLKVSDVYERDAKPVRSDNTLLEIIFEMSVKGKEKLFMVDEDGVLTGVIDGFCVIDKIFFF